MARRLGCCASTTTTKSRTRTAARWSAPATPDPDPTLTLTTNPNPPLPPTPPLALPHPHLLPGQVYAYDAEAEPAYRESETRAFRKALEVRRGAGNFHSVLVIDNCNLTHAEMRPYAEAAQVAGAALYVHTCKGEAGMGSVEECAARSEHGWSLDQVEQMSARWEETPLTLPRLVGCEQLDPRAPPPAPTPTPTPDAASLPASSQQGACGAAGSQAGSGGAAPARAANGGGGGGGGSSVWDAEEEEEEAEDEDAAPERGGDEYTFGRTGAPPVEGTVSGDVSALGGLMGSYAKKRVRWADEEQAKDDDFNRTKAGFTLQVLPSYHP